MSVHDDFNHPSVIKNVLKRHLLTTHSRALDNWVLLDVGKDSCVFIDTTYGGAYPYVYKVTDNVQDIKVHKYLAKNSYRLSLLPEAEHLVYTFDTLEFQENGKLYGLICTQYLNELSDRQKEIVTMYLDGIVPWSYLIPSEYYELEPLSKLEKDWVEEQFDGILLSLKALNITKGFNECMAPHNLGLCPETGNIKLFDFGYTG